MTNELPCGGDTLNEASGTADAVVQAGSRDIMGQGQVLNNIGLVRARLGDYDATLECYEKALALFRETDDRPRQGYALNDTGVVLQRLGRLGEALAHHQEALAIARETGDRALEAAALNGLGATNRRLRTDVSVVDLHEHALLIAREIGDQYEQAQAHEGLAEACEAAGSLADARDHWRTAKTIHAEIGAPEVEAVAARLAALDD